MNEPELGPSFWLPFLPPTMYQIFQGKFDLVQAKWKKSGGKIFPGKDLSFPPDELSESKNGVFPHFLRINTCVSTGRKKMKHPLTPAQQLRKSQVQALATRQAFFLSSFTSIPFPSLPTTLHPNTYPLKNPPKHWLCLMAKG